MTMSSKFKGSALSALAAMLALSGLPASVSAQEDGTRGEGPRFERQAPRQMREFRPDASRPARQEQQRRAAPAMTAPPQVQQVDARPQRSEQRRQQTYQRAPQPTNARDDRQVNYRRNSEGNRGFALDPNRARQEARSERRDERRDWRSDRRDYRQAQTQNQTQSRQDYREDRREDRRDWRQDRRQGGFALDPNRYRDGDRNRTYRDGYRDGRYADRRDDRRDTRNAYRSGYRDGRHTGYNDHRRWDRRWRDNRRYDWYGYRSYNRDHYRLGRYYSPYRNYSYRRLSIGFTLDNLFFGSRYWINDPWQYRLPDVYGPYRWVRYYDDVLLVNTYTGEVVDVIYDFFW